MPPYLGPPQEAPEAEDVTAAVRRGEFAGRQDAQTYGTPLRLLAIGGIGRTACTQEGNRLSILVRR